MRSIEPRGECISSANKRDFEELRRSVVRGMPFGERSRLERTAKRVLFITGKNESFNSFNNSLDAPADDAYNHLKN